MAGVVRARDCWKIQNLVMTGEGGGGGIDLSQYAGTETGDAQVVRLSRVEAGRRIQRGR